MSLRRKFLLAVTVVATLALAGCKVSTINYFPPHPAQVRVMNLMSDAPSIDLTVNSSPAFSNVTFQSASDYQNYDNATTSFAVFVTGSSTPLVSFSYPLAGEQPYTVLLYGTTLAPQLSMVAEVANAPTNGNIQVSMFNAAPTNNSVDVYIYPPGTDITTQNPSFSVVNFGSTTFNTSFAPGPYQIQVTTQGTKTVIYDSGGSALTPNVALSVILYTVGSGTLVNAAVLQSKAALTLLPSIFARIKAVNGASGVGPVNQLLGTLPVNLNVNFASASAYTQIPQGLTAVNFESSATPGATIASTTTTIPSASDVSTFVVGQPGSQTAYMIVDQNIAPTPGDDRLRFVNASPGSNPVNASLNGQQLASNVAFPTASGYAQIPVATVTVTFTDATTGAVVASQDNVVLTVNQTSTIYLIGPPGAQGIIVTQDN